MRKTAFWLILAFMAAFILATVVLGHCQSLMPIPEQQFFDQNGKPLSNGFVYTYLTGTSSGQPSYTDATAQFQNTNPILLNAAGFPTCSGGQCGIWLVSGITYRIVVQNSAHVQQYVIDGIQGIAKAPPILPQDLVPSQLLCGVTGADASAKIQCAINLLSPGGTVDARNLSDVGGTGSSTIDPGNKQTTLLLGPYSYNVTSIVLRSAFKIIGMSGSTSIPGATVLQSAWKGGNINNPIMTIPQGSNSSAQNVVLQDLSLYASPGNTSQDGILADCSNSAFSSYGLWYSRFTSLSFNGFNGVGLHLRCNQANVSAANQFDTFVNMLATRVTGGGEDLRIEGAAGELYFINSEFDSASATTGQNVYIGVCATGPFCNSSASQTPASIHFDQLTSQGGNNAVQLNGSKEISFHDSHHEHIFTGGYLLTNPAGISNIGVLIDHAYFAADGSYVNAGTGYLVSATGGMSANEINFVNSVWGQLAGPAPDNILLGSPNIVMCNNQGPPSFGSPAGFTFYDNCQMGGQAINAVHVQGNMGANQVAANITLTGWGAGSTVTLVTGTTQTEQFTITTGSVSGFTASPMVTVVFPNGFTISPPICTLQVVGLSGSGGAIIFNPGTLTNTSAIFTAQVNTGGVFTPAASEAYQVVMRCGP